MPTRKILGSFFDELVHASKPIILVYFVPHNVIAVTDTQMNIIVELVRCFMP